MQARRFGFGPSSGKASAEASIIAKPADIVHPASLPVMLCARHQLSDDLPDY
jgi:hypothetical protein